MSQLELYRHRQLTRWQRFTESLRSFTLGPYSMKNPPRDPELRRLFGSSSGSTGVHVNEESSLSFAAVWNAVVLIAGDVAKVPLPLYRRLADGGKEQFREHPLYELLHDEPNPETSSFNFRQTLQGHVLLWGNAFAEIERDGGNRPVALWPIMPYSVSPFRERNGGALKYRVMQPSGGELIFDRRDILHLSGLGLDAACGYPPIRKAMESIGLGLATERFGGSFFGNGATFGGIISYPVGLNANEQVRKENREVIESRHQGVDRSHRLLTLYEGATYQQLGVQPDHAQFLETRRFQIEEVARWFNLPVHKLKELARSTNNNIEHQGIEYATDTLQPWFRMWEGELRLKLIPRLERKQQFFEHITEALTRGDSAAQSELAGKLFSVGAISPNGIASKFNMNPHPDGNDIYVPSNMMPADLARKYWEAQIEKATQPPPPPPKPPSDEDEDDRKIAELETQLAAARKVAHEAEEMRDLAIAQAEEARVAREVAEQGHMAAAEALAKAEQDKSALAAEAKREYEIRVDGERREEAMTAARDVLRAECERQAVELGSLRGQFDNSEVLHTQKLQELTAQVEKLASDSTTAMTLAAQKELEFHDAIARAEASSKEFEAHAQAVTESLTKVTATLETARSEKAAADAEIETIKTDLAQMEAERNEAKAEHDELWAGWESERETLRSVERQLEAARAESIAIKEAHSSELETVKTDLARARADIATELERQRTHRAQLITAMRSLFVDATERLIQKESDRARKNQATPEKLRAWLGSFYSTHVEVCRQTFRPLVGPWVAVAGGDSDDVLDRLVNEHIRTSREALLRVLDAEDDDERAGVLERTLRRWEDERADVMGDALVREGMAP